MKHLNLFSLFAAGALAAGAFVLIAAPQAAAQPQGGQGRGQGPRADINGDGEVTYQELAAVHPGITYERYQQFDTNGDGVLSREDRPQRGGQLEGGGEGNGPREGRGGRGGQMGRGQRPNPGFLRAKIAEADINGDEQVTFEELQAVLPEITEEQFARLDRSEDGVLTKDDRPEPRGPAGHLMRAIVDADTGGDQQVSYEEFVAALPNPHEQLFGWFDQNGDGVLSKEDRPGRPADQFPGGEGPRMRIREADVNNDQQVTFEELQALYPELTQERFDRMDRNGDGLLSRDDRPQGPRQGGEPAAEGNASKAKGRGYIQERFGGRKLSR